MAQVAGWGLWSLVGSSSFAARGTPPSPLFGHSWPVIAAGRGAVEAPVGCGLWVRYTARYYYGPYSYG